MAAPGLTKDYFNSTIEDGVLTVSAEKKKVQKKNKKVTFVRNSAIIAFHGQ